MHQPAIDLSEARRMLDGGLPGAARARLEALVASHPRDGEARLLLGIACSRTREYGAAAGHYRAALDLNAAGAIGEARTWLLLGEALRNCGKHDEAVEPLTRAAAMSDDPTARMALAQNYLLGKRPADAEDAARAIVAARPDDAQAVVCLAMAVQSMGRPEEALGLYRRAAALAPEDHKIAGGLAMASNCASGVSAAEIRALHAAYAGIVERTLGDPPPVHVFAQRRPLAPGDPLRLGVLSPDFRAHAVSRFLEPLLANLDPARIEVFCYSLWAVEDETTARFRSLARQFRPAASLHGLDLARLIAADRVHVLIDAAGHTENTRLPVLALRPAPVQALYAGYPATTGLRAMDYRITDTLSDPAGSETNSVERLLRVDPCHLAYRPRPGCPPARTVPPSREPGGTVTFGALSAVWKLSTEAIDAWARVLAAVPDSRLLMKHETLRDARVRAGIAARFVRAGIAPQRLLVESPATEPGGLLEHYGRVDIALDTFPYCGTTTVCESLSMGVPVIARPGPTTASRTSLSVLSAVGLADLAADSSDRFVRIAAALAADPDRLADLRRTLPSRFAASPLRDEAGLAARFTDALLGAWERACAGAKLRGREDRGTASAR